MSDTPNVAIVTECPRCGLERTISMSAAPPLPAADLVRVLTAEIGRTFHDGTDWRAEYDRLLSALTTAAASPVEEATADDTTAPSEANRSLFCSSCYAVRSMRVIDGDGWVECEECLAWFHRPSTPPALLPLPDPFSELGELESLRAQAVSLTSAPEEAPTDALRWRWMRQFLEVEGGRAGKFYEWVRLCPNCLDLSSYAEGSGHTVESLVDAAIARDAAARSPSGETPNG